MPDEATDRVGGVLLAAGTSSRMGVNKLLLSLDGQSVVRRAANAARAAGLEPLVVVLGHESERSREELRGVSYRPVINEQYAQGIASSLKAGVRALPADVDAVVVLLADMPLVTTAMVEELVAAYRRTHARLVISDYEGVNAPPMLYNRSLFEEILASDDGRCGRQVVQRHRSEAEVVRWPAAALADLDVPGDFARLQAEVRELI